MSHALAAHRLGAKIYLDTIEPSVDLEPTISLFHRWIQQDALEHHPLIDVADYRHVPHGPGVMLICHEGHYALDSSDGQLGLLYQDLRTTNETLGEQLKRTVIATLRAGQLLTREPEASELRFASHRMVVRAQDRLHAPNVAETFAVTRPLLRSLATALYGDAACTLEAAHDDPRDCFAVRLAIDQPAAPPQLGTLLERAQTWTPPS